MTEKQLSAIVGRNLKALREASDTSAKKLATACGISPRSYWRWEKGENLPSLRALLMVANYFKTDVWSLIHA